MSSNNTSIVVSKLSKCYDIYGTPRDRLKQFIIPNLQKLIGAKPKQYFQAFWAVRDVSFTINKGETVGVIGSNGSGKSTLLQMICGTLTPSAGLVETQGRIAALLELGSGFNPDFTGRENIYLNAAILGLSRQEIDAKFNDIVSFADIGHFIDQPVKTYSSGMVARLAFSVSVQVNPDILVVDEALSVGDMAFQEKSFTKMKSIRDQGTSILFVSHSLSAVRNFCDKAIWLQNGEIRLIGERLAVCDAYQQEMERKIQDIPKANKIIVDSDTNNESETKTIQIITTASNKRRYDMGDDISISINLAFKNDNTPKYGVGIIIYDSKGTIVSILNTLRDDIVFEQKKESITLQIHDNHFAPGEYSITVSVSDEAGMFSYDKSEFCCRFGVNMIRNARGLAKVDGVMRCEHVWL